MLYMTIDFICQYKMSYYPFDIQQCNGTLAPEANSLHFVRLIPKNIEYTGPKDLMKYVIEENANFLKPTEVRYN